MKGKDTIAAKMAECFITIGDRRYNFMQMIDMEVQVEKTKTTVPRLGAIMAGHKSCGMEGTFSGTAHYNQSVMRQLLLDYKNSGVDAYFEMQITNDDPSTSVGTQTVVLYNVKLQKMPVAMLDADADFLEEEISFSYTNIEVLNYFKDAPDQLGGN